MEVLAEVGSEKPWNTHVKAEISFCIGKSYRRRCSSKVRAIEMRKLGQAHSLPPVWYWKESKQEPSDVEEKKQMEELVFSVVLRKGWERKKDLKYLENICDRFDSSLMRVYFQYVTKGSIKYRRKWKGRLNNWSETSQKCEWTR